MGRCSCRRRGDLVVAQQWPLRVDVVMPLDELTLQVFCVDEASLLEERSLDPADEVLDRAFLLGAARPAQLDAEPEIKRDRAEDRIPLGDLAVLRPLESDRLGSI